MGKHEKKREKKKVNIVVPIAIIAAIAIVAAVWFLTEPAPEAR